MDALGRKLFHYHNPGLLNLEIGRGAVPGQSGGEHAPCWAGKTAAGGLGWGRLGSSLPVAAGRGSRGGAVPLSFALPLIEQILEMQTGNTAQRSFQCILDGQFSLPQTKPRCPRSVYVPFGRQAWKVPFMVLEL